MLNKLRDLFKKKAKVCIDPVEQKIQSRVFSTDPYFPRNKVFAAQQAFDRIFQKPAIVANDSGIAMDSKLVAAMDANSFTGSYAGGAIVPDTLLTWYAAQSFIGYQLCAIIAQQWLVAKCCLMPARDAVRNGFNITVNDGKDIDPQILQKIKDADIKYKLNENLIQFVQMGRIFGIRIAMFLVESDDPEYYKKPFNIDGVTEGSYKGITQIDPYWITPQLDSQAAGNPMAPDFYEPTWWRINGNLIHRTHLCIFRQEEVADIIKPSYIYGGISIPQKIYERVYAAERTANEAPQLALTKRTDILKCDLTEALANQVLFDKRAAQYAYLRDNYAIKFIGLEEEMTEFDIALADLDSVIMTQYQLVAAAANVPATKLLGTQPKGFNSTGEFEEASYHEELESVQFHDLTPMIERHHMLLIKSEIAPNALFKTTVVWNPLDAMTNKEKAEFNYLQAQTGALLATTGAIDGQDERQRIIADPESGYSGLTDEEVVMEDPEELELSANVAEPEPVKTKSKPKKEK